MPELPEVETVCRGIAPVIVGRRIHSIQTYRPDLRLPFPKDLNQDLAGRKITGVTRRAKYILIHCAQGHVLALHLGMSGQLKISQAGYHYDLQKHDHMLLTCDDGSSLIFNDPRRFGMVFLTTEKELNTHKAFCHLGPEPLGNALNGPELHAIFLARTAPVKHVIMDQRVMVGVGNIYASEALYASGIHPQRPAKTLSMDEIQTLIREIRNVLNKAILAGGSTLKDYRQADGTLGYFQNELSVYGRAGEACPACDCQHTHTGGIQKIVQGGRATFFCAARQPLLNRAVKKSKASPNRLKIKKQKPGLKKTASALLMMILLTAVSTGGVLADPNNSNKKPAHFFESLYDIPLMPGLEELPDYAASFDKPSGRLAQAAALIPPHMGTQAVLTFYAQSLSQMGWLKKGDALYRREGEELSLKIDKEGQNRILLATLKPLQTL